MRQNVACSTVGAKMQGPLRYKYEYRPAITTMAPGMAYMLLVIPLHTWYYYPCHPTEFSINSIKCAWTLVAQKHNILPTDEKTSKTKRDPCTKSTNLCTYFRLELGLLLLLSLFLPLHITCSCFAAVYVVLLLIPSWFCWWMSPIRTVSNQHNRLPNSQCHIHTSHTESCSGYTHFSKRVTYDMRMRQALHAQTFISLPESDTFVPPEYVTTDETFTVQGTLCRLYVDYSHSSRALLIMQLLSVRSVQSLPQKRRVEHQGPAHR